MLLNGLVNLESNKHCLDLALRQEVVYWRICLFILDIFPPPMMEQVHPGWLAIKMTNDGPSTPLKHPTGLLNGSSSIPGGMEDPIGPDSIEGVIVKRQVKRISDTDILGLNTLGFKMATGEGNRIRGQVCGGHPNAAPQKFQAIVAQPTTDLQ